MEEPIFKDAGQAPEPRPTGFMRYKQVLERDWKELFLAGILTLLFFLPFGAGVAYAVLTSSVLVLIPVCIIGGMAAGAGTAGMYDVILRSLRDGLDDWWKSYKKSLKRNFSCAMLPGIVMCLFVGFYIFACYMLWVSGREVDTGTFAILAASLLLFFMIFSVWWPQIVLFEQKQVLRLKNCLLFCLMYFGRVAAVAVLQLAWGVVFVLFLPWTMVLIPILGLWYLWFLCNFLLYDRLDAAFRIEEQLEKEKRI